MPIKAGTGYAYHCVCTYISEMVAHLVLLGSLHINKLREVQGARRTCHNNQLVGLKIDQAAQKNTASLYVLASIHI